MIEWKYFPKQPWLDRTCISRKDQVSCCRRAHSRITYWRASTKAKPARGVFVARRAASWHSFTSSSGGQKPFSTRKSVHCTQVFSQKEGQNLLAKDRSMSSKKKKTMSSSRLLKAVDMGLFQVFILSSNQKDPHYRRTYRFLPSSPIKL